MGGSFFLRGREGFFRGCEILKGLCICEVGEKNNDVYKDNWSKSSIKYIGKT